MKYYIWFFFFSTFFPQNPSQSSLITLQTASPFSKKLQVTDTAIVTRCTVEVELETIAQTYFMRAWQTQAQRIDIV